MKKSDFYYDLPKELIAQKPLSSRDQSRLLCLDRQSGDIRHRRFCELPGLLQSGDCLVLNDSRVIPARLLGKKDTGGVVELLLLSGCSPSGERSETQSATTWMCLARPGRRVKAGTRLFFGDGELTATVIAEHDEGKRLVEFDITEAEEFYRILERLGKTPLPPYIREELNDPERYQTVYSRCSGSAAAPTAGLHFTKELLLEICANGIEICSTTLHVGLGTFKPVKADDISGHKMHSEYMQITDETAAIINRVKSSGGRVIAIGTTSCRALESCADLDGMVSPFEGHTDIFIYPGYEFKCIDGLLTNFHLPESTLIMLVSAFAGRENVLRAYSEAIAERYRFYSFGDACFII